MDDLKNIKKEIYTSFYEDGLFDLLFGFGILTSGFLRLNSVISSSIWGTLIAFIPLILVGLIYSIVKRYVITPRIGFIKLKSMSKDDKILSLIMISGLSTYGILKFLLHFGGIIAGICYGLLFSFMFSLCAHNIGTKRQYVFAALVGTCLFLEELSQALIINILIGPISFIILGAFYTFYSLLIFYKFMRKYPIQE